MKLLGNVCYVLGIVVAIFLGLCDTSTVHSGNVVGSVDCDTSDLYKKNDDCRGSSKPNKTCIAPKQRCKASENGDTKLCKSGEGTTACSSTSSVDCYPSNNDDTSDNCTSGG